MMPVPFRSPQRCQPNPAEQLALLYARRWQIELWFRDLKTSMGMNVLRCQSPKMIHKELEMFFIAYNLIRGLMLQASRDYQVDLHRLSFQGTVDSTRQFSAALAQARSGKRQKELIRNLGRSRVQLLLIAGAVVALAQMESLSRRILFNSLPDTHRRKPLSTNI